VGAEHLGSHLSALRQAAAVAPGLRRAGVGIVGSHDEGGTVKLQHFRLVRWFYARVQWHRLRRWRQHRFTCECLPWFDDPLFDPRKETLAAWADRLAAWRAKGEP